jgi:hypothetical protein
LHTARAANLKLRMLAFIEAVGLASEPTYALVKSWSNSGDEERQTVVRAAAANRRNQAKWRWMATNG